MLECDVDVGEVGSDMDDREDVEVLSGDWRIFWVCCKADAPPPLIPPPVPPPPTDDIPPAMGDDGGGCPDDVKGCTFLLVSIK